ncbi:MAG: FixH family protein [Gammaproteobacteria bacterium]
MTITTRLWASSLFVTLLALAGCENNQDNSANDTGATETASASATTASTAPEPEMGDGMGGGRMSGGGMGGGMREGMDHSEHMQHMRGMGNMDHARHREHMAAMGGMEGDEHMDHSQHMHGDDATTEELPGLNVVQASAQGLFQASVTTDLDPVVINEIHSWTLHLETADGEPLDNAVITVDGGMPAHSHGLPTAPEVTENLGEGNYLVEGLMFQMPGHWQVRFDITAGDQNDIVTFDFGL